MHQYLVAHLVKEAIDIALNKIGEIDINVQINKVVISLGTNDVGRHKLDSDQVNDSNWNCGSNESRGVANLLRKDASNEVKFTFF